MKTNGFLTAVCCGLFAVFLLSCAGSAASAAPRQERTAAQEEETDGRDAADESDAAEKQDAADERDAAEEQDAGTEALEERKTEEVSENRISENSVSGDQISENRIPALLLLRPSGGGNSVSRNSVSRNAVSLDTVSRNAVSRNSISQNAVSRNTVSRNSVSQNSVSRNTVSENGASKSGISGNAVSGNGASKSGVSGNAVSGNGVSENRPAEMPGRRLTLADRQKVMSSHRQTMQANEADRKTISGNDIDFSEIKIACLGDSITQAVNLDSLKNYQALAWPNIMKEALGAKEAVNLGIGGSSIGRYWADAFVDRYSKIPEDTDLILVMGGTNDGFCASFVEFGNEKERAPRTFWGDLDELMEGLKEDYPEAEVIFLTPLPNSLQDYLKAQRKYLMPQEAFPETILTLAGEHGLEVFDLYNSNILDGHDRDNVLHLMPDGVHPNEEGYRILGEHVAAELIRLLDERKAELPEGFFDGSSEDGAELEEEDWSTQNTATRN